MKHKVTRFFYRTLEPVHVGAGGYRLGRVDKSICREPGTNVPKIPGTSLSGAARAYAAELCGRAGAAGTARYDPSADANCPIFYTFGYASDQGGGRAGSVSIGDAYILLFPVPSLRGPLGVTTARMLPQAEVPFEDPDINDSEIAVSVGDGKGLNLGWLWFDKPKSFSEPDTPEIEGPIALVPERLFAPIVNSNLEVRTSVAIDHKKGIADPGKLFSYEAIPRSTVLFHEVVVDDYRKENGIWKEGTPAAKMMWNSPLDVLRAGLELMATLGL